MVGWSDQAGASSPKLTSACSTTGSVRSRVRGPLQVQLEAGRRSSEPDGLPPSHARDRGVSRATCDWTHIKSHYFWSHKHMNPHRIIRSARSRVSISTEASTRSNPTGHGPWTCLNWGGGSFLLVVGRRLATDASRRETRMLKLRRIPMLRAGGKAAKAISTNTETEVRPAHQRASVSPRSRP